MVYRLHIQNNLNSPIELPSEKNMKRWSKSALKSEIPAAEVSLSIVDREEIRKLNAAYRHKDKPTNVLSFPARLPKDLKLKIPFLGDIIICAEIVKQEAIEQSKTIDAHWAHMIVHGHLHLLGYDHENDHDAKIMEEKERVILHSLGFTNPYHTPMDER